MPLRWRWFSVWPMPTIPHGALAAGANAPHRPTCRAVEFVHPLPIGELALTAPLLALGITERFGCGSRTGLRASRRLWLSLRARRYLRRALLVGHRTRHRSSFAGQVSRDSPPRRRSDLETEFDRIGRSQPDGLGRIRRTRSKGQTGNSQCGRAQDLLHRCTRGESKRDALVHGSRAEARSRGNPISAQQQNGADG